MIYFELYDLRNGGILDDFGSEEEAIASLRATVHQMDLPAIAGLALFRVEEEKRALVAREDDLVSRVVSGMTRVISDAPVIGAHPRYTQLHDPEELQTLEPPLMTGSAVLYQPLQGWTYNPVLRRRVNVQQVTSSFAVPETATAD